MTVEENDMEKPGEGNRKGSVDPIRSADSRFDSERAELFEALGHETRIRILQLLSKSPSSFSAQEGCEYREQRQLEFSLGKAWQSNKNRFEWRLLVDRRWTRSCSRNRHFHRVWNIKEAWQQRPFSKVQFGNHCDFNRMGRYDGRGFTLRPRRRRSRN
jgi:hypothetical protein